MPFKIADVDKHKKGLSDANKKKWVQIANGILSSCSKTGKDILRCEVTAIRTANGTFSDDPKTALEYSESVNPLNLEDHESALELSLSEIDDDEYQLVFPIGTFLTGKYGEVNITRTYVDMMVKHWKKLGKDSLFLDKNHDFEDSYGWPEDVKADEDGIKVKWNFTKQGKELIDDKVYKFYSAAIGWKNDMKSGKELFPVLKAVTLCNNPVMNQLPGVHLSDNPTHGEGSKNIQEGQDMTPQEIITALLSLSEEDKKAITDGNRKDIADFFGLSTGTELSEAKVKIGVQDEKIKLVLSENRDLTAKLKVVQDKETADNKTAVIEAAIKDGKILPKNKEKWEGLFDKDPEGTTEILKEKGSEIDLSTHGNGKPGQAATQDDIAAAKLVGMELSEYMKLTYGEDK